MGAVTAEVPAHLRSGRDFEAARERELGEAGAEEGADAVILPESPRQLTVVRVVGGQFRAAPPQPGADQSGGNSGPLDRGHLQGVTRQGLSAASATWATAAPIAG